jgi:hypothetical protein
LFSIGSRRVPVTTSDSQSHHVALSEASIIDFSALPPQKFGYPWKQIYSSLHNPYWGEIIKISNEGNIQGFIRYELLPQPEDIDPEDIEKLNHQLLEVKHLETVQTDRIGEPLGKWLLWYAIQVACVYCSGTANNKLVTLVAVPTSKSYYEKKIEMNYDQSVPLPDGTIGHAFSFSRECAEQFCRKQEIEHGIPLPS